MSWPSSHPLALGRVSLIGAGPGDPELITVRGLRRLRTADVLLYDRLIHPDLVDEAPAEARKIFVGKAPGRPGIGQAAIHRLMIDHARLGRHVVRLKGGDPFVFGRGGEEIAALTEAGVPWEVVPAVSSAIGAPASAGIPVTHRGLARNFAVVTAHQLDDEGPDWGALAAIDTVVVLMGVATLATVTQGLIDHGRDPQTPVAVIARGTLPDERSVVGCLVDIAGKVAEACLRPPATVVIGEVVGLRPEALTPVPSPTRSHPTGRGAPPPSSAGVEAVLAGVATPPIPPSPGGRERVGEGG